MANVWVHGTPHPKQLLLESITVAFNSDDLAYCADAWFNPDAEPLLAEFAEELLFPLIVFESVVFVVFDASL